MVELNDYPTTGQGLYGNGSETYFVNKHGVMFCVQSPDLVDVADATIIRDNRLPVDCVQLGTADISDLEIPGWCVDHHGK